jgi:hypothetical protein
MTTSLLRGSLAASDAAITYLTPTFVQRFADSTSSATPSVTVSATAGNLLIAVLTGTVSTYPDVSTAGWTFLYDAPASFSSCYTSFWAKIATGGSETVASTSANVHRLSVFEFSNTQLALQDTSNVSTGSNVSTLTVPDTCDTTLPALLVCFTDIGSTVGTSAHTYTGEDLTTTGVATNQLAMGYTTKTEAGTWGTVNAWTTVARATVTMLAFTAKTG